MVDFVVLLSKVIFACHFLACVWHYVGTQGLKDNTGWLIGSDLRNKGIRTRYIYSFYTAAAMMSTVGNDIKPVSEL